MRHAAVELRLAWGGGQSKHNKVPGASRQLTPPYLRMRMAHTALRLALFSLGTTHEAFMIGLEVE